MRDNACLWFWFENFALCVREIVILFLLDLHA